MRDQGPSALLPGVRELVRRLRFPRRSMAPLVLELPPPGLGGVMFASVEELRRWHQPVAPGVCAAPGSVFTCACRGTVYIYSCGHVTEHTPWSYLGSPDRPSPGQRLEWDCPGCGIGKLPTPYTATCEKRQGQSGT